MKLCIFAGTFNPIHIAHLEMAQYVIDNFKFNKIIFIPAYNPPHKNTTLPEHRYNMVSLAIQNNPQFEISNIEYQREGKSYTYMTILELYKKYQIDGKINFIIGTDAFEKIESWYKTDELKKLIDFIVFVRAKDTVNLEHLREKGYNFQVAKMDFIDISSTELRTRIKENKPINDIITKEVGDYIEKFGLYR